MIQLLRIMFQRLNIDCAKHIYKPENASGFWLYCMGIELDLQTTKTTKILSRIRQRKQTQKKNLLNSPDR